LKKNNKQQFEATDLGNTERFISEHRGRFLSVSSANQWLKWNGRRSSERTEASADRERTAATSRVGPDARQVDPEGGGKGKLLSPARRRACIDHVRSQFKVSERRACRVLGQHRSTQRHCPKGRSDEDRLVADMVELARQYGRYGYRRIAALLRDAGWSVSDGRVERLW
jgi:hypothetical protein